MKNELPLGVCATLPKAVNITQDDMRLFRIAWSYSPIDPYGYHIGAAFFTLFAKESKDSKEGVLLPLLGALIFEAGRMQGVKQERLKRRGRVASDPSVVS